MEKAVKQRAVLKEKIAKIFINGKDAVPMNDVNKLEGHRGSALHGVKVTAGGAEAAVAAERDKFQLTAVRTAVHGTAKGRVTAVNHFFYVLNDRVTRM